MLDIRGSSQTLSAATPRQLLAVLGTQEEQRRTGAGDEFHSEFVPAIGNRTPGVGDSERLPRWYVLKYDVSGEKLLRRILEFVGMPYRIIYRHKTAGKRPTYRRDCVGYMFLEFDVDHDEWEQVLDMPHVSGILGWMMPLPDKQSELRRSRCPRPTRVRWVSWAPRYMDAGRSKRWLVRKYNFVVIDEAAFTAPNLIEIWQRSIKPTLLDCKGKAIALSNANGIAPDNFVVQICRSMKCRFAEYHGPTRQNRHMPADEVARLKRDERPLVFEQEAVKSNKNDATAAAHWAVTVHLTGGETRPAGLGHDQDRRDAAGILDPRGA